MLNHAMDASRPRTRYELPMLYSLAVLESMGEGQAHYIGNIQMSVINALRSVWGGGSAGGRYV
jgi:hypothetical protein